MGKHKPLTSQISISNDRDKENTILPIYSGWRKPRRGLQREGGRSGVIGGGEESLRILFKEELNGQHTIPWLLQA